MIRLSTRVLRLRPALPAAGVSRAFAAAPPVRARAAGAAPARIGRIVASSLAAASLAAAGSPWPAAAAVADGVTYDDLPPKAQQAYQQYWPALQLAADSYVFELYDLLPEPGRWDSIGAITESTDIGSAASVSKLEREYLTPMRILALAFPPDAGGEEMQAALNKFQGSMFQLSRLARAGQTTGNVAAPSAKEVAAVEKTWDDGRTAINSFFEALNSGTAGAASASGKVAPRLVGIPPKGAGYPRSKKLYTQLRKDAALCRNRGGEALAGLWGNLMVYGTVPGVNPCGSVNMANYFAQ
mmetsp:Transcript_14119/g.42301  ORF Transcript_14119/g.42301 Transcript_14119/m.42301 type:complete len:298 (+) Transcript_14119:289-1182(+)